MAKCTGWAVCKMRKAWHNVLVFFSQTKILVVARHFPQEEIHLVAQVKAEWSVATDRTRTAGMKFLPEIPNFWVNARFMFIWTSCNSIRPLKLTTGDFTLEFQSNPENLITFVFGQPHASKHFAMGRLALEYPCCFAIRWSNSTDAVKRATNSITGLRKNDHLCC